MPYEKGHPKYGGRKKGTPNKYTQEVRDAVRQALEESHPEGPVGYLKQVARDDPAVFMGVVKKLIPNAIEAQVKQEQTVTVRRFGSGRGENGRSKKEDRSADADRSE